jgi:hypothetical protein
VIFLIVYDRLSGRLETLKPYDGSDRRTAEQERLQTEIDLLRQGKPREVVLLDAASEEALRRTHRRYFEDVGQIVASGVEKKP